MLMDETRAIAFRLAGEGVLQVCTGSKMPAMLPTARDWACRCTLLSHLVCMHRLQVEQKGKAISQADAKGPIRLRLLKEDTGEDCTAC